jgi:peroxiredoxin
MLLVVVIPGMVLAGALIAGALGWHHQGRPITGEETAVAGGPAPQEASPLGRKIEDFTLPDWHGRPRALSEWADEKAIVIVFLGTDCPLCKLYGPRLAELAEEFGPPGVSFLAIDANDQDGLTDIGAYAARHKVSFPILKDAGGVIAGRMGALRTPEAFVLDETRTVRYWGRIDDQYGIGVQRAGPARRHVAAALEELLAGRPVSRPAIRPVGCRIGRAPSPAADRSGSGVTYTREVSRLLQRRCVECHRSGEVAPFALTGYADAAAWAPMIREIVTDGRMPPWFADPGHGHFRNEARLTDDEKRLLVQWIDDGCPQGDPADLPPPPTFPDDWRIPRPDLVLDMADRPYDVPAEGEVRYQYFLVDPGFTEDRYLLAVQVRPGNPAVVHHALVLIQPPGDDGPLHLNSLGALIDYAPGMAPPVLPEGMAIRVPAGSKFLFQMHYTPNGSPQQDCTRLGIVFADPGTVTRCVEGGAVVNQALAIPAGAADYRLTAETTIPRDALLLSLSPHMHLRGKSFRFEAAYPDGTREVLLDVPRYDFNWQLRYELAQPKRLPRGTRLICTAHYDNSADNPANPDPSREVGWGEQTSDEMLIGFFATAPL